VADSPRPDLADTAIDTGERERRTPDPTKPELADTVADSLGHSTAPFERTNDLARGSTIGRYLVLEVIGTGGMGVVYSAYDPELDRKVALKLVRQAGRDLQHSGGRARMLREAQAIARLSHPNVVAVHDVGTAVDNELFIAMELVEGGTLRQWLTESARSTAEIVDMFVQAGRGLAAAHRAGLIHRDFKPDNVLVDKDGRARVVDFGLVRAADATEEIQTTSPSARVKPSSPALSLELTQVGAVMGTAMYIAPEQLDEGHSDARSDQYSFCIALHEALSGANPFAGEDFETVRENVLAGSLTEIPSSRKVPAHVRAVLRRGTQRKPTERFPSMDALLAVLSSDPRARTKRIAIGVGVVALLGAGVATTRLLSHRTEASCGDARAQLAGAWDSTRREELQKAFAATRASFAETAFTATARGLDRYADAWVLSYEDSCKATHVRHEQSVELLDTRSACLRQRKIQLATLVDLLARSEASGLQRAHVAVEALSPIDECNDMVALRAPIKVPADPAVRESVAKIRDELARAQALLVAARYKDALAIAKPQYEAAQKLGYGPVEAEAGMLVAALVAYTGDAAGALETNLAALSRAIASHHDESAFRIAIQMIRAATNRNEFARAHDWIPLAQGLVHRLGDPLEKQAALHTVKGHLATGEGKFEVAVKEHEQALALRERVDPNSHVMAKSLNNLAYVYGEIGRYDDARKAGERGVALYEALLGPTHPDIASVLVNLGNVVADQGDLDAATRLYERALPLHEAAAAAGQDRSWVANVINNLGEMAYERGRWDEALELHRKALAIRESLTDGEADVTMSHANIGNTLRKRGDIAAALSEYKKSLAIGEPLLGKDHPYVGDALVGVGECALALRMFDEAQPALERALAIRKAGSRPAELAEVELALAKTLWERGQRAKALEHGQAARNAVINSPGDKKRLDDIDAWLAGKR
jgi:eukaryotic-like serine/threonine-protein kinase